MWCQGNTFNSVCVMFVLISKLITNYLYLPLLTQRHRLAIGWVGNEDDAQGQHRRLGRVMRKAEEVVAVDKKGMILYVSFFDQF